MSLLKFLFIILIVSCASNFNSRLRYNKTSDKVYKKIDPLLNTGVFISYGQSNSENCGEIGYYVVNEVFQFFNDSTFVYSDPSLGGICRDSFGGGSVWGLVGDKLIEEKTFGQVVFSMNGWGGTTMKELGEGELYSYFKKNYFSLIENFGKVDGILFHQGESNHKNLEGNDNYYEEFHKFYRRMNRDGITAKFYLSKTSYCDEGRGYGIDENLLNIQDKIITDFNNVFRGPNTDELISSKDRLQDQCHFSLFGYNKFAELWVKAISDESEY